MDKENMTVAEKVSYIKGLAEGLKLDDTTSEGKVLLAVIDVLGDIAVNMEGMDEDLADLTDVVNDVDERLNDVEDDVYGSDDDDDAGDYVPEDDEQMYELKCPGCQNSIMLDFKSITSGRQIECPNCGAVLELNVEDEEPASEE